ALSLHDALPISGLLGVRGPRVHLRGLVVERIDVADVGQHVAPVLTREDVVGDLEHPCLSPQAPQAVTPNRFSFARPSGVMRSVVQGGLHTSSISTRSIQDSTSSRSRMSSRMNSMQGQAVAVNVNATRTTPSSSSRP